ncbi:MAG: HEAT repeat domain-containing protein, partial [Anaerolineales bacterium]
RQGREWVKSFEPAEETPAEAAAEGQPAPEENAAPPAAAEAGKKDAKKKGAQQAVIPQRANLISKMTSSGLLQGHRENNRVRFAHPVLSGYLAGLGVARYNQAAPLAQQPAWTGRLLTGRYLAAFGDPTPLVESLLSQNDPMFARPQLAAARLLRDAPRQAAWRGKVIAPLVQLLQNPNHPLGLRAQAMAALVSSGDPAVAALLRQLAALPSPELRQLIALGMGALQDVKSIEILTAFTRDYAPNTRQAACLALVAIGTHPALEAAAHALLSGDEDTRRAAAEAFATHPGEGYAILKDGATSQDILVRRAVVFGLARLGADWAVELLQKMQVEDEQWVVRTAATQALEGLNSPNPRIPHYLSPPAETPWVIEFAGRHGMGVTPGQSATDIFLLALKSEKPEEQFGAVNYLRFNTSEGVIAAFYALLFSDKYYIRDVIFNLLAEMASNGVKMPDPHQYGLG